MKYLLLLACITFSPGMDPAPTMVHSPATPKAGGRFKESITYDVGMHVAPAGVVLIFEYHVPGAEPPNEWGWIDEVDMQVPTSRTASTVTYETKFFPPYEGEYRVRAIAMHVSQQDVVTVDHPIPVAGSGH